MRAGGTDGALIVPIRGTRAVKQAFRADRHGLCGVGLEVATYKRQNTADRIALLRNEAIGTAHGRAAASDRASHHGQCAPVRGLGGSAIVAGIGDLLEWLIHVGTARISTTLVRSIPSLDRGPDPGRSNYCSLPQAIIFSELLNLSNLDIDQSGLKKLMWACNLVPVRL